MSRRLFKVSVFLCMTLFILSLSRNQITVVKAEDIMMVKNVERNVEYPTLQDAVNAVGSGESIQLLTDITTSGTVSIPGSNVISFTLDLNGHVLDGGEGSSPLIQHNGTRTFPAVM